MDEIREVMILVKTCEGNVVIDDGRVEYRRLICRGLELSIVFGS